MELSPAHLAEARRLVTDRSDEPPEALWEAVTPELRPAWFRLLDLAADLPRLTGRRGGEGALAGVWPELGEVLETIDRVQALVDRPVVPGWAEVACCRSLPDGVAVAEDELSSRHCVTVGGLLGEAERTRLDAEIARLHAAGGGGWGELARGDSPLVYEILEEALGGAAFREVTGFDLSRDAFTLTLSLQDLEPSGIGWHRDLYWPEEWVGEDVFAVLYALGDDSPEKGGAFLYYVPWENAAFALYRRRHQATLMWNSADPAGRLLHAVSGYSGADTSRHLVILQCLRRG